MEAASSPASASAPMSVAIQNNVLPRSGLLLLVALSLFWGVNWPIMKTALSEVPPFAFRSLCVASGAVGLLLLARLGGQSLRLPRGALLPVALAALFNITLWNLLIAYGITLLPSSGRAAILAYTMPLWAVMLGAPVLGERLSRRQGLGLVAGLAGLAVLMGGDVGVLRTAPLGAALVVGAAISWAIGTVIVKRSLPAVPTSVLVGWQMAIGGLPIFLGALWLERGALAPVSLWPALSVLYNMLICFIFCYWAWFRIVAMTPLAVSGLSTMSIPLIGVLSGALLLGEPIGPQEGLSVALVVVALAAVLLPGRAAPAAPVA
jgi:drug/metabolite transporter (DMT)-like permease